MNPAPLQLLVIEDDPNDAALIEEALRAFSLSCNAVFISDGAEALDYLWCEGSHASRNPDALPHLILLDLKLPRVDGLEIIRRVRSDAMLSAIVILVFSSSSEHWELRSCYGSGANSFLVKPVHSKNFIETLLGAFEYWAKINKYP